MSEQPQMSVSDQQCLSIISRAFGIVHQHQKLSGTADTIKIPVEYAKCTTPLEILDIIETKAAESYIWSACDDPCGTKGPFNLDHSIALNAFSRFSHVMDLFENMLVINNITPHGMINRVCQPIVGTEPPATRFKINNTGVANEDP